MSIKQILEKAGQKVNHLHLVDADLGDDIGEVIEILEREAPELLARLVS